MSGQSVTKATTEHWPDKLHHSGRIKRMCVGGRKTEEGFGGG